MKKTQYLFTIIFALIFESAKAQQDPMYSQYWVNATVLNPAQAGATGETLLNVTGRNQWVNVKGAPKTASISLSGMTNKNLGLAASYVIDKVGPSTTHTLNLDFAYFIMLNDNWRFTSGIRLSALVNQLNFADYYTITPNDPLFSENVTSGIRPNGGFGFLLSSRKLYIGYAQPRVVNYAFGSGSTSGTTNIVNHRFAYIGLNHTINSELEIRPSLLLKHVENAPLQLDVNLPMEIRKKVVVGLGMRTGEGIGALIGLKDLARLDIYYCYDYPTNSISMISKQTHQITLNYPFSKPIRRINSPRYFN